MISDFARKNISILGVEGRDDINKVDLLAKAIMYSQSKTGCENSIIFSYLKPSIACHGLDWQQIKKIEDRGDYSRFLLKELHKYQNSIYSLIVQRDGFVINEKLWDESYLEYDYIGAPWPSNWNIPRTHRVGNGGFSLRSHKLISLCAYFDYTGINTDIEDSIICFTLRKSLENLGIKFAPLELSAKFSIEWLTEDHVNPEETFGFHDKHNDITKAYYNLIQ